MWGTKSINDKTDEGVGDLKKYNTSERNFTTWWHDQESTIRIALGILGNKTECVYRTMKTNATSHIKMIEGGGQDHLNVDNFRTVCSSRFRR